MRSSNFFSLSKLDPTTFWRACLALALSVLIHLLMLDGLDLRLPLINRPEHIAQMQLVLPAAAPKEIPSPRITETERQAPLPRSQSKTKPEPAPAPEIGEVAAPEEVLPAESVTPVEPNPAAITTVPEEQPMENVPDDELAMEEPDAPISKSSGLMTGNEAYITTDFELRQSGSVVGVANISFRQYADGTYSLVSTTEAKGLVSLFLRGQLVQMSKGLVMKQGLQPLEFSYEMTSKEDKTRHAQFDWYAGNLLLQTGISSKTVKLVDGAQDLLSFMYQFIFVPPMETMEIAITNGKKLDTYAYAFEGEEDLNMPMGNLRTMHILHNAEDEEKTELWLAVDYRYMPVKIRKTEENGTVIEQVATKLSTDILNLH
jgi:hypothetical protein